ncbi:MAG: hypothetical protein OXG42_10510 [Chloroflexi bacterium]|nr:hypothetical protein [Chloroflexota bacterium]
MVAEDVGNRVRCPIDEFRGRLDELLARVESGETVAVTYEDRVLAVLAGGAEPGFYTKASWSGLADFLEVKATWPRTNVTREDIQQWRHEGHEW